jgi:molybdate transport system ATP-binding protein
MGRTLQVRVHVLRRNFRLEAELTAPPGVTILFGPSGAGKSTLLSAIAGLVRPLEGRIALGSEVWFDSAGGLERPVELRRVGLVFQAPALFPHFDAAANVAYGIDRRLGRRARREAAVRMLERMKVGALAERMPSTLSGGEAQRVALARAFAAEPAIVLLDEAFSAMDQELRRELAADVRHHVEAAGIPAIHVTHQPEDARQIGERVVLLEAGRVRATGSTAELLAPG